MVDNLTKNFFAIMSFQWPRALASCFALAFLNLMPFAGVLLAHGWERLGYAVALFSMFSIYVGMSTQVGYSALLLHPASRQHGTVCVHHAAFDILDPGARRGALADMQRTSSGVLLAKGNYKIVCKLFNIESADYKKFLQSPPWKHDCQLPFKEFRQ